MNQIWQPKRLSRTRLSALVFLLVLLPSCRTNIKSYVDDSKLMHNKINNELVSFHFKEFERQLLYSTFERIQIYRSSTLFVIPGENAKDAQGDIYDYVVPQKIASSGNYYTLSGKLISASVEKDILTINGHKALACPEIHLTRESNQIICYFDKKIYE